MSKRVYVKLTCCWVGDEQIALCPTHAAAPALLAALERIVGDYDTGDESYGARAALRAARGGE
jgi:hypothetical protein